MNKSAALLASSLLMLASASPAMALTPDEALTLARENDARLRGALKEQQRAELLVERSERAFTPLISADAGYRAGQSPQFSPNGVVFITTQAFTTNLGLQYILPLGTRLSGGVQLDRSVSDSVILGNLGATYGAGLTLAVDQPLLRGFGRDIGRAQVQDARLAARLLELERTQLVRDLSRDVRVAYWRLWFAQQRLELEAQSLELAQAQLERQQIRLELGASSPADLISFKLEVATAREAMLAARTQIQARALALSSLIHREPSSDVRASTATLPAPQALPALAQVRAAVLQNSPQLSNQRTLMARAQLQLMLAQDAARADLSAVSTLSVNGLGRTPPQAAEQLARFQAVVGYVGMRAELPLRNRSRQADAERAQLALSKLEDDRDALTTSLLAQAAQLHLDAQSALERLALARESAQLASDAVQPVVEQFEADALNAFDVVQARQRAREAALRTLSAEVDALIALITLRALMNSPNSPLLPELL